MIDFLRLKAYYTSCRSELRLTMSCYVGKGGEGIMIGAKKFD